MYFSVEELILEPSILEIRDLPQFASETTDETTTKATTTAKSASKSASASASTTGMPQMTTSSDLPTMESSSSSDDFTTPSIGVPSNTDNPYIYHNNKPSGTVFIAVGALVGAVLLVFALFHLIHSLVASRTAKKANTNEKSDYHRFARNSAYSGGLMPSSTTLFSHGASPSVSKLPLMSKTTPSVFGGSQAGDTSTVDINDHSMNMSHHDLTNMFVSPTKEMTHTRLKSQDFNATQANLSLYGHGRSQASLPAAHNKPANVVPSVFVDDASESQSTPVRTSPKSDRRKKAPSMYLEDLMDM